MSHIDFRRKSFLVHSLSLLASSSFVVCLFCYSVDYSFYSILSYNIGLKVVGAPQIRWLCVSPAQPCPVFSCPSWAGKVNSYPFFNIVLPPPLSTSSLFPLTLCPVWSSLLSQKTFGRGQTILLSVSWTWSEVHHSLQWLLDLILSALARLLLAKANDPEMWQNHRSFRFLDHGQEIFEFSKIRQYLISHLLSESASVYSRPVSISFFV